jgi:hypothetical protein
MRSTPKILFGTLVALVAVGCAKAQKEPAPPPAQAQRGSSLPSATDWRTRMQSNHNADSSIARQVRRLTTDLGLTPAQQTKVRQLSQWHNERIQQILDTAPASLSYGDFQTQVHAISAQYHDSVNAILTPLQLERMKAMVGRLDSGTEARQPPTSNRPSPGQYRSL